MRALENVSAAHLGLADSYAERGLRYLERARPVRALQSAVRRRGCSGRSRGRSRRASSSSPSTSTGRRSERDPTSATALIQFARVFWEWRQAAADKVVPREPAIAHAREAEWYARRAVAMVEAKLDGASSGLIVADRSGKDAQGALDQVRSGAPSRLPPPSRWRASARCSSRRRGPHEALGVLASAETLAPEHPAFDDVRWMLGQALLCAASREWRADFSRGAPGGPRTGGRRPARSWMRSMASGRRPRSSLDRVREHERAREGRPFAGRTDIAGPINVCRWDWLAEVSRQEGENRYSLKQTQGRGRSYLCGRLGVRAPRVTTAPRAPTEEVYLRVWGGGAERLRLESKSEPEGGERERDAGSDVVSLAPTTSRFYYFAQLESEDGRPLSPPLALDPNATPPRPPSAFPARCADARTLITLEVGPPEEPAPAEARGRRSRDAAPTARVGDGEPASVTPGR